MVIPMTPPPPPPPPPPSACSEPLTGMMEKDEGRAGGPWSNLLMGRGGVIDRAEDGGQQRRLQMMDGRWVASLACVTAVVVSLPRKHGPGWVSPSRVRSIIADVGAVPSPRISPHVGTGGWLGAVLCCAVPRRTVFHGSKGGTCTVTSPTMRLTCTCTDLLRRPHAVSTHTASLHSCICISPVVVVPHGEVGSGDA